MKASEIRKEARESLKGKWLKAACIYLIFYILTFIIGQLSGKVAAIFPDLYYSVLNYLFYYIPYVPLFFGLIISFMKLKRNEEIKVWHFIKDGFSRFKKSWGITWHTFFKTILHLILGLFICIVIPLILSFIAFATNTDPNMSAGLGMSGLIVLVLGLYLLIIWMFPKYLLYFLSYNISYDNPDLSSKECVLKSAEIMKGNRVKYIKLLLSFIGWYLLISVVCSYLSSFLAYEMVGNLNTVQVASQINELIILPITLFLIPYIQVATVCFYEKVATVGKINSKPAEKVEE